MLHAHLVERADDGALEQASGALDAVRVDISPDPLLGRVVTVSWRVSSPPIPMLGLELVGVDRLGLVADVALDEVMDRMLLDVREALYPDAPTALDRARHPVLVVAPVLAPLLPPIIVSSSSTTPTSVGPRSGSLPIASRMRWQRNQAVL